MALRYRGGVDVLEHFAEFGYARLGRVCPEATCRDLVARAEALMLGADPELGLFFQHDAPTGRYEDLAFKAGWVGPSLNYRKVERLERDEVFLAWIRNPEFERLATAVLGPQVALYRSVLWNKAADTNMAVPWHQDDGRFWGLDRPPSLQFWTALDDAPVEAGCLEVVPGSHRGGLATPEGGTIPPERLVEAEAAAVALPAERGEVILVHNHVWHRTGQNTSGRPRRAVSVSVLDGAARCRRKRRAPRQFLRLWG